MQAHLPERPDDTEFTEFLTGTVSEPDTSSTTPRQLMVPVAVSLVLHICLLVVLRQLVPYTDPGANNTNVQTPSIRISFRPRPAAAPEPEPTVSEAPLPTPAPEINEATASNEPATQTTANQLTDEAFVEPPSPGPRLLAPALLDVRDLIQSRAQNDATARIYNNVNCDERQRRTDLIDCGDEDPNAQYNFADAEQNATVEFFSALNPVTENTSTEPADRTSGEARTRATLNHLNGNLGANPLIRSVMGEP